MPPEAGGGLAPLRGCSGGGGLLEGGGERANKPPPAVAGV